MLAAIDSRSLNWLAESVVPDEVSSDARSPSALVISASVIEPELKNDVKSAFRTASLRSLIQGGMIMMPDTGVVVGVVVEVMISLHRLTPGKAVLYPAPALRPGRPSRDRTRNLNINYTRSRKMCIDADQE